MGLGTSSQLGSKVDDQQASRSSFAWRSNTWLVTQVLARLLEGRHTIPPLASGKAAVEYTHTSDNNVKP